MPTSSQCDPVTRFAPSPSGYLHLGHAYAALTAANKARLGGGEFLLRLEDIDRERCRSEFEDMILTDLQWLGLTWKEPILRQSERHDAYQAALSLLFEKDLLYSCFCTRQDIRREIESAGAAPHGPDGPLYPGTCRSLSDSIRNQRISDGEGYALRLDMRNATSQAGRLEWNDIEAGPNIANPDQFGDVVLARKNSPTSYHLSVVVDDHFQGVTLVTRGEDLFPATHVHRLLQALLTLNTPDYLHHKLIMGPDGKKFSKRDQSVTLHTLRHQGRMPDDIYAELGLSPAR